MLSKFKSLLRDEWGLSPVFVLPAVGLCAHLALNAALRKPPAAASGLIAPLLLGIAIEAFEIWTTYRDTGLFAPGNDPPLQILARHGLDILLLLALPALLVAVRRTMGAP